MLMLSYKVALKEKSCSNSKFNIVELLHSKVLNSILSRNLGIRLKTFCGVMEKRMNKNISPKTRITSRIAVIYNRILWSIFISIFMYVAFESLIQLLEVIITGTFITDLLLLLIVFIAFISVVLFLTLRLISIRTIYIK